MYQLVWIIYACWTQPVTCCVAPVFLTLLLHSETSLGLGDFEVSWSQSSMCSGKRSNVWTPRAERRSTNTRLGVLVELTCACRQMGAPIFCCSWEKNGKQAYFSVDVVVPTLVTAVAFPWQPSVLRLHAVFFILFNSIFFEFKHLFLIWVPLQFALLFVSLYCFNLSWFSLAQV